VKRATRPGPLMDLWNVFIGWLLLSSIYFAFQQWRDGDVDGRDLMTAATITAMILATPVLRERFARPLDWTCVLTDTGYSLLESRRYQAAIGILKDDQFDKRVQPFIRRYLAMACLAALLSVTVSQPVSSILVGAAIYVVGVAYVPLSLAIAVSVTNTRRP